MPRPHRSKVVKSRSLRAGHAPQIGKVSEAQHVATSTNAQHDDASKPHIKGARSQEHTAGQRNAFLANTALDAAGGRRSRNRDFRNAHIGQQSWYSNSEGGPMRLSSAPSEKPITKTKRTSMAKQRQKTPSPLPSTDSDLYGLSPGGEASRAKLEASLITTSVNSSKRKSLARPPSALRVRDTPGIDSSVLALNNFKRRPRKPSIIRLNTAQNSEVEDNTADLSLSLDIRSDDFAPVDQSTPLNSRKTRRSTATRMSKSALDATTSSSARKRKFDEAEPVDLEVPATSPLLSSPPPVSSPVQEESSLPEPEAIIASIERDENDEPFSETMAPPMSSSSGQTSPNQLTIATQDGNVRKKLRLMNQPSTKQLEELLPKARRKPRLMRSVRAANQRVLDLSDDEHDGEPQSTSDEADDDQSRRRAHTMHAKSPLKPKKSVLTESKSKSNSKRLGRQEKGTRSKSGATPKKPSRRRTYGSRLDPEKENEEDTSFNPEEPMDENTTSIRDEEKAKFMSMMRDKFAAVDGWEMEFETVDGESSSLQ